MSQAGGGTELLRPLVFVLGMHRSGTSLCANILHALGVDMADDPGISPANRRGHWERPRINDLHDAALALFGRSWNEPTHHLALPDNWWNHPGLAPIRQQLAAFLQPRLAAAVRFGFKDPRTSRLLPLWPPVLRQIGARPVYVFCVRDPAQVARSVSARDRFPPDQAAYRWLIYNAHAVCAVADTPVCVVRYEDWFTAPQEVITRLAAFVDVAPPSSRLAAIVDADLRHDAPSGGDAMPPIAADLHRRIAATAGRFDQPLLTLAETILGCERAVMPFLRDAAILQVSVADECDWRLERADQPLRDNFAVHQL